MLVDEVRKPDRRTLDSVEEIRQVIERIQNGNPGVVVEMVASQLNNLTTQQMKLMEQFMV
ncbi:hypothetical protein [Pseudomonas sp.]|uniref:hypothetical protein n=1 Tax=Pseudomonas sp. TaxID=306 RepID=UPI003A971013